MSTTLAEVARLVGGEVVGDDATLLTGVAGIREAGRGDLTFLSNPKYERFVADTSASAIIVSSTFSARQVPRGLALLMVDDPYEAIASAMRLFAPEGDLVAAGVHKSAVVSESVVLGDGVSIGPNVVVMDGAVIGDGAAIHAGSYVGRSCSIGRNVVLYPGVTVRYGSVIGDRVVVHPGTVIGSDGFGFAGPGHTNTKVPQIGNVVIEDDVEIGANVCIDRATLGSTRICRGSKIDNLVQIGHNVVIGEDSIVVAQVGISGSTRVGRGVVLAGQAGLVGHIEIGDGAMVGAQAGVTRSIPAGERVSGYPARKHAAAKRLYALTEHLPALVSRVKDMEARLGRLESEEREDGSAGRSGREED
ncbi:MAG: UDP-3-O-(3-hydroxymyristoyl)glucosamine N-acyltransferase [Candidatus Eisenbacteria bacterium]|nr:UDP-3-O-(3-hydroxymyristoyl)glucosamine N-acyltransferase [Candidatus Eisenbacteria bacterium]